MSVYLWSGLLLGRNHHFQQQPPRIRKASRIVLVTTNDYQCIWAHRQPANGSRGGLEAGAAYSKETEVHPPPSSHLSYTHTHTQSTKPFTMCREIESICFERLDLMPRVWRPAGAGASGTNRVETLGRGGWEGGQGGGHPTQPSLLHHLFYPQGRGRPRQNFALRVLVGNKGKKNQRESHHLPNQALIGG